MKHLIIHGDPRSGKSLFIKNLLIADNYYAIDGRKTKVFDCQPWRFDSQGALSFRNHDFERTIGVLW